MRRGGVINEINMTPFIDVMLVLLIIFMVAAPLMTVGVPLDLPQTRAAPLNVDAKPVTLSIRATGQIFLGETELADEDIVGKIAEVAKQGFEERIFVRGDKKVDYGRVAQVMSIVTSAGYKSVALVTEPDQQVAQRVGRTNDRGVEGPNSTPPNPASGSPASATRRSSRLASSPIRRRRFPESQEGIPVEVITDNQFSADHQGRDERQEGPGDPEAPRRPGRREGRGARSGRGQARRCPRRRSAPPR